MTKTIPIIWMPLLAFFLIRQQRWKQLSLGLGVSLLVIAVLVVTVLPSFDAWRSLLNSGVAGQYQSSIHALVRAGLETLPYFVPKAPPASHYKYALLQLVQVTLIIFAAFYSWVIWRMFRRPIYLAANLLEDMGWVALVLMLYATSWLMPWYVSILYAFAAVLPKSRLFGMTTLMFGISSGTMYLFQTDVGLRSLVTLSLPTLTLLIGAWLRSSRSPNSSSAHLS